MTCHDIAHACDVCYSTPVTSSVTRTDLHQKSESNPLASLDLPPQGRNLPVHYCLPDANVQTSFYEKIPIVAITGFQAVLNWSAFALSVSAAAKVKAA